jgi:hypothetical protein
MLKRAGLHPKENMWNLSNGPNACFRQTMNKLQLAVTLFLRVTKAVTRRIEIKSIADKSNWMQSGTIKREKKKIKKNKEPKHR